MSEKSFETVKKHFELPKKDLLELHKRTEKYIKEHLEQSTNSQLDKNN